VIEWKIYCRANKTSAYSIYNQGIFSKLFPHISALIKICTFINRKNLFIQRMHVLYIQGLPWYFISYFMNSISEKQLWLHEKRGESKYWEEISSQKKGPSVTHVYNVKQQNLSDNNQIIRTSELNLVHLYINGVCLIIFSRFNNQNPLKKLFQNKIFLLRSAVPQNDK